jgi:ribokinase
MTGRVIVVGSVNIDLVITVPSLPAAGRDRHRRPLHAAPRVARAATRPSPRSALARRRSLVGAVGDDDFGRAARSALDEERIDTSEVRTPADAATGVAFILVERARGEQHLGGRRCQRRASAGACDRIARAARPRPGDVVLVGHEIPTDAAAAALRAARDAGATTILNPAPAAGLDAAAVALADIVTPK